MGARIDYVSTLKPLQIIGKDEELSVEKRLSMILDAIAQILDEKE